MKTITKPKIADFRKALKLTQREMAEKLNISQSRYALVELGLRKPTYGLAKEIANIFNKDIEELFFNSNDFRMKTG